MAGLWACVALATGALGHADALEAGFHRPPDSTRPWVYWFWLNGYITPEGVTADLEAMKRVGIRGALLMEVDQGTPPGPVAFASEEWRRLFRHALHEAKRLGMEINMNNDAGWCGSGGPWVPPDKAMQRVVWTEIQVAGPKHFSAVLPQPKAIAGFYRDIAVLAFPTPARDYRIADIEGESAVVRRDLPPRACFAAVPPEAIVKRSQIRVLTAQMNADGWFEWDVPEGNWTVLRIGHTPTRAVNAPSPPSGRGLECDKLSPEGIELHFREFIEKLVSDAGPLCGKTLVGIHVDSWETGAQNWTPRFREEFRQLRGYDPLTYLPVLAGRVVDSMEVSLRFLYDVRQTVNDLLLRNYAGRLRELANRQRLRLTIEAYGNTVVDNLAYGGRADEPMGEFWAWPKFAGAGTLTEMASAAHVYGKRIVGAEAFTAGEGERWLYHPGNIKALADWAFCRGINRLVIHRYAHQPWLDRRPGMCMGPWGLHYERTQTWWEESRPWHEYLARCQYLLQQGSPVVDILCLAPEGAPRSYVPPPALARSGYSADSCPAEALVNLASARDGRIVFPGGMSYRVLLLPAVEAMTPELLMCLQELVRAGAVIIGGKTAPVKSPSLTGYPACDEQVRQIAQVLWQSGRIITDKSADEVLAGLGVPPDFKADRPLDFTHRRIGNVDIYFVANTTEGAVNANCVFRVEGRVPEIWHPETGRIALAPRYRSYARSTRVPLRLEGGESVFVVFRRPLGQYNEHRVTRVTRDGIQVWPPAAKRPRIVIRRALWGPLGDEARTKDVTRQVQRMVDSGLTSFVVAELAAEGDPAVGVVKTLRVEYEADGRVATVSATDPERIYFDCPSEQLPSVQLFSCGASGLGVVVNEGGSYVVEFASGRRIRFSAAGPAVTHVKGPWEVCFPPGWGAPGKVEFSDLLSWTEHPDPGIKYFSGTATYRARMELPRGLFVSRRQVTLDLGRVEVVAAVKMNGQDVGILWKPPFRTDVTDVARPGVNHLEIRVTNLWPNRLIGDEQLPEDSERLANGTLKVWPDWLVRGQASPTGRYTFTTWRLWLKNDPLVPSGLLGPVRVVSREVVVLAP